MTIEVRQMVIKSTVGDDHGSPERESGRESGREGDAQVDMQRLREEILAEIHQVVALKLRDMAER
jgi:hypothetical protein